MSIASPITSYLLIEKPPNALTARVNGTPTDPFMTIPYDTGSAGSITPLPGMTVWFGSTSGGQERGVLRLRSWNGSNLISVAESDDVGPLIQDNDFITIKTQWRLWPIYPRAVITGLNATVYVDYDIPYSDQLSKYKPVAVAGVPAVVEFNGATALVRFVGDRSFALASGASITGYLWTAPGSVEGTSTSQGTEGSPVTFTWTSTGQKLVYLRVTDSNGKTATNYTWVFVVDPNNPETVAYVNFDAYNDNFDYEQGGGSCTFTVHPSINSGQGGSATIADFPNEAMIVMASRPTTPGQTTPTGYWPNRDNVHFVGYIVGNTVRQNPVSGDVTFTAMTIDSLMRNMTAFPVSLTYQDAPQDWTMAANLTTDRAASYLWHYHSTLSLMASIRPSNYAGLIQRQDFGPNGGIHSQLDSELMSSLWGKVVVNHQGVVHHLIDYNLMNDTERGGVTVRKSLHKGVWVDDLTIEERHAYSLPVNIVKMSGIVYTGGSIDDICPLFSESPGNAPKAYGSEMSYDRLILTSQADLNVRCGRALAKNNAKYSQFGMRFINDGSFTIAPQELFTSNIEAADNDRGLALTTRLLPRRISRTFDNQGMHIAYDIGFEPETDGPPGVTVDLPCNPPEQKWPDLPVDAAEEAEDTSASQFGIVWNADEPGTDGKARFGEVGSISYGAAFAFNSVFVSSIAACGLSSTQALIVYKIQSNSDMTARIVNLSGSEVTSAGAELLLTADAKSNPSVIKLTSTKALVIWDDGTDVSGVILTVSGSTLTAGTITDLTLDTFSGAYAHATRLSDTLAIAVSHLDQGTSKPQAVVLGISGATITPGTPADATANTNGNLGNVEIAALDGATAVVFYRDQDVTADLRASLLYNISGAGFTLGGDILIPEVNAVNEPPETPRWAMALDSSRAIAVYGSTTGTKYLLMAAAVERSGTTLTAGTPVTLYTPPDVIPPLDTGFRRPSIAALSSSKAVIAFYGDAQDPGAIKGTAISVNISGTVITDNADDTDFSAAVDNSAFNAGPCALVLE